MIERDRDTGYYVGHVPELADAHSAGETKELTSHEVQLFYGDRQVAYRPHGPADC